MKIPWKAALRVYLLLLLLLAVLAVFWALPVVRFLQKPVTAPAATGADNPDGPVGQEGAGPHRGVDPRSLLGVHESMIPKFEGMVQRVAPDSAEAWTGLGILYQFKDKFDEAERCYVKAIELNPDLPDAHYRLGTVHHARNELFEAISAYKAAMRARSGYLNAYYSLAAVYQSEGKFDDAAWLYREILRMDPKQYQAHNNLGILHEERGEFAEAVKSYAKAVELNPRDPVVLENLEQAKREFGTELRMPPVNQPPPAAKRQDGPVPPEGRAGAPPRAPFRPEMISTLRLKNGRTMSGEVVSRDAKGVWFRIDEGTEMFVSNEEIGRIEG